LQPLRKKAVTSNRVGRPELFLANDFTVLGTVH
jgi:hypothetical protein